MSELEGLKVLAGLGAGAAIGGLGMYLMYKLSTQMIERVAQLSTAISELREAVAALSSKL